MTERGCSRYSLQYGPDASLDIIIKTFTIIYGNVRSYDILMGAFYRGDQGEDETVTSFAP